MEKILVVTAILLGLTMWLTLFHITKPTATTSDIQNLASETENKIPIVYSPEYNISLLGLEELHPFDTKKYQKVFRALRQKNILTGHNYYTVSEPANEVLERVHSPTYLKNLTRAETIADFTEVSEATLLPNNTAYKTVVVPARYATAGSILAGELALQYGWAVNLGGGYHHASADRYEGFCAIADITLSIKHLQDSNPEIKKVMIIDLDAHQGNGHSRDFIDDADVFIIDMYNSDIYPNDTYAETGVDYKVELSSYTSDDTYLSSLSSALENSFAQFTPDVIYYVAGTDILENDPLGKLSVSSEGVISRDSMVFSAALERNIPIVMLLSGGYQKNNGELIADSIENLLTIHNLTEG